MGAGRALGHGSVVSCRGIRCLKPEAEETTPVEKSPSEMVSKGR
jgi:hypothetical protein